MRTFNDRDARIGFRTGSTLGHTGPLVEEAILVGKTCDGEIHIISSTKPDLTVDLLDKAMEAIDGQRLPPDAQNNGSRG